MKDSIALEVNLLSSHLEKPESILLFFPLVHIID